MSESILRWLSNNYGFVVVLIMFIIFFRRHIYKWIVSSFSRFKKKKSENRLPSFLTEEDVDNDDILTDLKSKRDTIIKQIENSEEDAKQMETDLKEFDDNTRQKRMEIVLRMNKLGIKYKMLTRQKTMFDQMIDTQEEMKPLE